MMELVSHLEVMETSTESIVVENEGIFRHTRSPKFIFSAAILNKLLWKLPSGWKLREKTWYSGYSGSSEKDRQKLPRIIKKEILGWYKNNHPQKEGKNAELWGRCAQKGYFGTALVCFKINVHIKNVNNLIMYGKGTLNTAC